MTTTTEGAVQAETAQICALVVRTLELVAIHEPTLKASVKRIDNGHMRLAIKSAQEDVPFLLGGRGANIRAIAELANLAMPSGHYLTIDITGDQHPATTYRPSGPIDIPPMDKLDAEMADKIIEVVCQWHLCLAKADKPEVEMESTPQCDCVIVGERNLSPEALGALRRVVGWAAKTHGRIGFIEWQRKAS